MHHHHTDVSQKSVGLHNARAVLLDKIDLFVASAMTGAITQDDAIEVMTNAGCLLDWYRPDPPCTN